MTSARKWSRRRVLAAGGAGTVAIAAGATGIVLRTRDGGDEPPAATVTAQPSSTATPATPTPATITPTATPQRSGGVLRIPAANGLNFDTFDAQRCGEPSVVEVLGRTHSRLVQWRSFGAELVPDLASSWEQPDGATLVLHLDPAARWQDRAPLNGRAVTAQDLVAHLGRSVELARSVSLPLAQRAADYLSIARVTAPDARTVRIESERPDALLLPALAGRFALVQAPEAVEAFAGTWNGLDAPSVVGSGPFTFEGGGEDGSLSFARNAAGHRTALLDEVRLTPPIDEPEPFLARDVDEFLARDRRAAQAVSGAMPSGVLTDRRLDDFNVISTMAVGAPPWSDPRLRLALTLALHRGELAERLFGGRALAAFPVPPGSVPITEAELRRLPGYGVDFPASALDARARWQAAGGPGLGTITIDFPSIFDPRYSASSVVVGMLNEVLGGSQFRPAVETYTAISRKTIEGAYGNGRAAFWFGWAPAFTTPEPARVLFDQYHSSTLGAQTAGFADATLDGLLEAAAGEFDARRRRERTAEAMMTLLQGGGGGSFDWLVQFSEVFRWDYVAGRVASAFWPQHLDAVTTVDRLNPRYPRR